MRRILIQLTLRCTLVTATVAVAGLDRSNSNDILTRGYASRWTPILQRARSTGSVLARLAAALEHVGRIQEPRLVVLPSADTAAMLFWALLASGQINMRKVDGWQTLNAKPTDQPIDLAA